MNQGKKPGNGSPQWRSLKTLANALNPAQRKALLELPKNVIDAHAALQWIRQAEAGWNRIDHGGIRLKIYRRGSPTLNRLFHSIRLRRDAFQKMNLLEEAQEVQKEMDGLAEEITHVRAMIKLLTAKKK